VLSTNLAGGPNVDAACLRWTGSPNSAEAITNNGELRQVRSAYVFADILDSNNGTLDVFFYRASDATTKDGDLYETNELAMWTGWWRADRGEAQEGHPAGDITVTEVHRDTGGALTTNRTVYSWPSGTQVVETVGMNPVMRTTSRSRSTVDEDTWTLTTLVLSNGLGSATVSRVVETYDVYEFGVVKVQETRGDDEGGLTTTWTYQTADPDLNSYGRIVGMTNSTGYWETYAYNGAGRQESVKKQYGTAAYDALDDECYVMEYTYDDDTTDFHDRVTTSESLFDEPVSQSEVKWNSDHTMSWNLVFTSPEDEDSALITVTRYDSQGRVSWRRHPDGTALTNCYETAAGGTNQVLIQYWGEPSEGVGTTNVPVITKGTKTITVVDAKGQLLSGKVLALPNTNIVISGWEATEFDSYGRPTLVEYADGTTEESTHGCCGLDVQRGRDGILTSHTYDQLGRVATQARQGVVTTYGYDPAGRVVATLQNGALISSNVYDTAGRLTKSIDAAGNPTTYSETIDESDLVVRTTTFADNSTEIRAAYPDGTPKSISGTAARPREYEYGAGDNARWVKEILIGEEPPNNEYVKTFADFAGRQYRVEYADDTCETNGYDWAGHLVVSLDRQGVVHIHGQDMPGWVRTNAVSASGAAAIDFDGHDRITTTEKEHVATSGELPARERTTIRVWHTNGVNASVIASIAEHGLTNSWSWGVSWGQTNASWARLFLCQDGATTALVAVVTNVTVAGDGTYTVSVSTNGLVCHSVRYGSGGTPISGYTNTYDALNRVTSVADSQSGTTKTIYDSAGRAEATILAVGTSVTQTNRYFFDSRNRVVGSCLPDGTTVTNIYHPTGDLAETRGSRTYPVAYTYDPQGRMRTMTTWKDRAGNTGQAVTTWNYNPQNGLLESKEYADTTVLEYGYTSGRLTSRTWARNLTVTNGYNKLGDLTGRSTK
jgi:YD repeat-containing protein